MLTEFRQKSQITIPKDIVNKIGLSEGDKIDISEKNGVIYIIPVSVYPKSYVEELKKEGPRRLSAVTFMKECTSAWMWAKP